MFFCPIAFVAQDGAIPEEIVPIPASLRRFSGGPHIEICATLGEVLAHVGAVDEYGLEPETLVLRVAKSIGVSCGGEAVYTLQLARHEVSRLFGEFTRTVYLVRDKPNHLSLAIPA